MLKLKIDETNHALTYWREYIVPGHPASVAGSAMNIEKFELTFPPESNSTYRCVKY